MFLSSLLYVQVYHVNDKSVLYTPKNIGLIKHAKISFNITNSDSDLYLVSLLNKTEQKSMIHKQPNLAKQLCTSKPAFFSNLIFFLTPNNNKPSNIITIPESSVYQPIVVSCHSNISNYSLIINFKNHKSLLDSRWFPSFITLPIILGVTVVLISFWSVNQIIFSKGRLPLHNLISLTCGLFFITVIIHYVLLLYENVNQPSIFIVILYNISSVFFQISFFLMLYLLAKGWCIIQNNLTIIDYVENLIFCILYFGFSNLDSILPNRVLFVIFFSFSYVALLIFWILLIYNIKHVDKHIKAHLLVISRAGIDPKTTPVYSKHTTYELFMHSTVIYFSGQIVSVSLQISGTLSYGWSTTFFRFVLDLVFLSIICILFHIQRNDCSGYLRVENDENLLQPEEIDSFKIENDTQVSNLIKWEEGMLLPPPPHIVERNQELHTQPQDLIIDSEA